ncbi:MAG: DUF4926 domain-containing protein [Bacteroidota bacterium]
MPHSIREYDCVALWRDLPEHGLRADDVGTVVFVHGQGEAFEVEFVAQSGRTLALLTLRRSDVRRVENTEETVPRTLHRPRVA